MDTQKVTLSIPKEVLRKAKMIATQRRISLSSLLTRALEDMVSREEDYQKACQRHLRILQEGHDLGSNGVATWSREGLHER